jgi:hypothetical protein
MEKLSRPRQPADDVVSSLGSFVDHWLAEGIISPEQARRMLTSPAQLRTGQRLVPRRTAPSPSRRRDTNSEESMK